jgi:hypothetical protein
LAFALTQIPTGLILDRFGVTFVNRLSTFLWSVDASRPGYCRECFPGIFADRYELSVTG